MTHGWLRAAVPKAWSSALLVPELDKVWHNLEESLAAGRKLEGFLPPERFVFRAMQLTPPNAVKVVVLGQDPYHGPGQAEGLSFSVPVGIKTPPSLRNIFKELAADLGVPIPAHGNLVAWADRGVLLLNTVLTVEPGSPLSHKGLGWESITAHALRYVAELPGPRAFLLWGAGAAQHAAGLDPGRHLAVVSAHPSPLSAYRGFFGSRPFSRVNTFLRSNRVPEIDWSLPEVIS